MSTAIKGWCACGASFSATSTPPEVAERLRDTFRALHDDPECRPCDAKTAAAARRRQEREAFADG